MYLFLHPCYHYVPGADISKAGGDFLPWALQSRLQRARVICYVRDTKFRERKKEVERKTGEKRARHPDQPVREKSRPFIKEYADSSRMFRHSCEMTRDDIWYGKNQVTAFRISIFFHNDGILNLILTRRMSEAPSLILK